MAPQPAPSAESAEPASWPLPLRAVFRFTFCYFLLYASPEPGRVTVIDAIPGGELLTRYYVRVRLRKIDTSWFRLISRGFHWISEFPFNR